MYIPITRVRVRARELGCVSERKGFHILFHGDGFRAEKRMSRRLSCKADSLNERKCGKFARSGPSRVHDGRFIVFCERMRQRGVFGRISFCRLIVPRLAFTPSFYLTAIIDGNQWTKLRKLGGSVCSCRGYGFSLSKQDGEIQALGLGGRKKGTSDSKGECEPHKDD